MGMITRVLVIVLALLLVLPGAAGSPPVEAKQKSKPKTVTQTFTNNQTITIPTEGNANPFPSFIQVEGFKQATITDVNITVNGLTHDFPNDVNIMLTSPSGLPAILMGGAGGGTPVNNLTLAFDDAAGGLLPDDTQLNSGTFRPSIYDFPSGTGAPYPALSVFNGYDPNGQWQLFVNDDVTDEGGNINSGWTLEITATVKVKSKKHHHHH
jgi:subtilisin-like proprotein convertase family protein